jgi:hypothetical protein
MGILTDFVAAPPGHGVAIGEAEAPAESWPSLRWKGMETIKLAQLYCSIVGIEYSNEIQKSFPLVGGDQEEGPWVFEFPQRILEAIVSVPDGSMSGVCERWVATEEMSADGYTVREAEMFLRDLASLGRQATNRGDRLYLWVCL